MTVVRSGAATDVGRVRSSNQDRSVEEVNLFAVADGMGGHAGGEVAARVAVDALRSSFSRHPTVAGLRQAVVDANAAVWRQSQVQSDLRGMGTTVTAAAVVSGSEGRDVIAVANVGDSRAYVYSGGRITQVTADHSLAEEKVRLGELTEAEAAVHPHRHILTRALGISSDVDVDLWELHLEAGDRIVLCSDGLTNEVSVDQMAEVLGRVADPREAALALVHAANEHGGSDNITVVVVDVLVGEGPGSDDGAVAAASAGATAAAAASTSGSGRGPGPAPPDGTPPPVVAPPLPPPPAPPSRPTPESREVVPSSRRRRAAGVPRRVTFRVLLFALLVVAIVAAAYGVVRWYATDNWFVTLDGRQLVVYQGRPGGLLWFRPKLVDRSTVTTAGILPESVPALRADVDKPSLAAARTYISNLHQEFLTQLQTGIGQSTSTTPATTFPATTTTTTTTTTVPAAG